MSMWLDPPDGDADDGVGAGLGGFDAPPPDGFDADGAVAPVDDGGEWTPDQGYPDSTGSVRVWVDPETRRLTKVRISNRWRERARGTSLSSMFDEAFLLASARLGDGAALVDVDALAAEAPLPELELSWDSVIANAQATLDLQRRMLALNEAAPEQVVDGRWEGVEATGASDNLMVEVRLGIHGETSKIDFNETWLKQSRVSEVCDCIMQAHRAAYDAYTPPTYEMGDRMRLAIEAKRLNMQTMAMMRGGTR